ncbi:MAG TPA: hypothetical protein VGO48_06320 [Conexibacter sp.]|nr:hypothetical protein [Conexibacter sp.]
MSVVPREIAGLSRDAFLLARYADAPTGRPDGRAWEQAASGLLIRPGLDRRQHAGTLGLFGAGSASGVRHELDGVGHGHRVGIWLECKARAELDKTAVAVFAFKCLDLYRQAARDDAAATAAASWWPILVSSEPVSEAVHRSCIGLGIALCVPDRMPLPMLLRMASRPSADLFVDKAILSELVRLAEPVVTPLQTRWRIDVPTSEIRWTLHEPTAREIGDLLFLQEQMTADVLDGMDLRGSTAFERIGSELADRMTAACIFA